MINIYPANRLENLVVLLDKVMQTGTNSNILTEEVILVQSKGMQHWLNLKLAENQGISMNLAFSLPMQFFWQQIRQLLGKEMVPEQSSYSREVLSWRIDAILTTDKFIANSSCQEPTQYWLNQNKDVQYGNADKRFQLACQLADLFEQYQIFRPDWLLDWEQNVSDNWQAIIWQMLIAQEPLHPIRLLKQAIIKLADKEVHLPERINLFGINTLPPLWLEFLSELGKHTQVHFFHLNPCVEYWGDLKTDKAYAREQFYRWLNSSDVHYSESTDELSVNPLLSNLGGQGKDFLALLQEHTSIEIPVFESSLEYHTSSEEKQASVLQEIQNDILNLLDARQTPQTKIDDSIFVASAHSALREIQALHDWLLQQFNQDETLTPKDILVMCPNVENYAPYVEAVFAHGWSDWSDWSERVPPLPCSIADRTLKDSESLVQAFIDLLELPDSRFQVSQILSYLRLPAVKKKFAFDEDDMVLVERWINHAAIHWGIDSEHKQKILATENSNNTFSWKQGLDRLLLGFAQGDQQSIYQQQLLLPDVEGDEALLLGRCIDLIQQLQFYARELQTERRPEQWQHFLQKAKESLFFVLPEDNNAQLIIDQAIDDLGEYTAHAGYEDKIPLAVVRDFLNSHFSRPEPGRQFMAGQVTFCSMVPMRSVPFRIIAVLGLNDGEFPRQRQPIGFDLMAKEVPRKGDRSRRGDDRYLFLEALVSCRDKLYLSYQGHDIKNNNPRQPSLVLHELMNYLEKGYGWQLSEPSKKQCYQVPLQAFSKANYEELDHQHQLKSFNEQWLKLTQPGMLRNNLQELPPLICSDEESILITAEELVRFFDNPGRSFAQNRLKLFFETQQESIPQDSEPFVSDHLDRYLVQDMIIKTALQDDADEIVIDNIVQEFRLSGHLPDNPDAEELLLEWQVNASEFAQHIKGIIQAKGYQQIKNKTIVLNVGQFEIEADLPLLDNHLFFWRMASPKGKDDIRLWIHHLIAQVFYEEIGEQVNIETQGLFRGKNESLLNIEFGPVESARDELVKLLEYWQSGMQQPLLLNAILGQNHCLNKQSGNGMSEYDFNRLWIGDYFTGGLSSDPYIYWFWSGVAPQWQGELQESVEMVYDSLYQYRREREIE